MREMNIPLLKNFQKAIETGRYNPARSLQLQMLHYVFVPTMQKLCNDFVLVYNNYRQRKNVNSKLPSNVQPEHAYNCPEEFEGQNCLTPIDPVLIEELLDEHYPNRDELIGGYVEAEHGRIFDQLMEDHILVLEGRDMQETWELYDQLLELARPIIPDEL